MHRGAALLAPLVAAWGPACGGDRAAGPGPLEVLAASSLTEPLGALGRSFEAAHPGTEVRLTFAASSALARQIHDGARADVVITADEATMARIVGAGDASSPEVMARNRLAILVERGNPRGVTGLADLARPDLAVVLCAPEVPCGRLAAAALRAADVTVRPRSFEENVKAVVSRVVLGEADAGVVYRSEVRAAGARAQGVEIDLADAPGLQAVYLVAATARAPRSDVVRAWIDFVLSAEARQTLEAAGFLRP